MIESILNQIDLLKIAYDTTKGNHYTDDLYQELYLELLENSERTIELNDRGELKPYVPEHGLPLSNFPFGSVRLLNRDGAVPYAVGFARSGYEQLL